MSDVIVILGYLIVYGFVFSIIGGVITFVYCEIKTILDILKKKNR